MKYQIVVTGDTRTSAPRATCVRGLRSVSGAAYNEIAVRSTGSSHALDNDGAGGDVTAAPPAEFIFDAAAQIGVTHPTRALTLWAAQPG